MHWGSRRAFPLRCRSLAKRDYLFIQSNVALSRRPKRGERSERRFGRRLSGLLAFSSDIFNNIAAAILELKGS